MRYWINNFKQKNTNELKTYCVDFSGYAEIEARSKEEAEQIFIGRFYTHKNTRWNIDSILRMDGGYDD